MKKKLALVLAAAMALTSLPTVAFGKSSNSISTVVSAKEDTKLAREQDASSNWIIPTEIPRLELVSDSKLPIELGSTINLILSNAEWLNETNTSLATHPAEELLKPSEILYTDKDGNAKTMPGGFGVTYIDSSTIQIRIGTSSNTSTPILEDKPFDRPTVTLPSGGNNGEALSVTGTGVNIEDQDSDSSDGNHGFIVTNPSITTAAFAGTESIVIDLPDGTSDADDDGSDTVTDGNSYDISVSSSGSLFNVTNNITTGSLGTSNNITLTPDTALTSLNPTDVDAFTNLGYQEITVTYNEMDVIIGGGTTTGDRTDNTEVDVTAHTVVYRIYPYSDATVSIQTGTSTGVATLAGDDIIKIPLLTELTGAGDAQVRIDSVSGNVTTGPYTFANVSAGDVKVTVNKTVSIPETGKELENIVIEEVTPGSLEGETYIRLRAPSNFTWDYNSDTAFISFAGGLSGTKTALNCFVSTESGVLGDVYRTKSDSNEITVYLGNVCDNATRTRGTIILSGLVLKPTDDAKFGDVNVTVRGKKVSSTSVLVGEYKDYVVTMEPEDKDLPVIISGYMPSYPDNRDVIGEEDVRALELHISESVPNSWWGLRKTTLSMPDGVQIRGAEIKATKGGSYQELVNEDAGLEKVELSTLNGKFTDGEVTIYKGERLEFKNVKVKDDEKAEVWVKLYVSAEPGFTGDIVATLAGGGMDEDVTATIATVVNPVNVSMKQTEVKLGYKNIELNDITITENKAGAIRKEYYSVSKSSGEWTSDTTRSTAKMILQIGDTTDNQYLKFDSVGSYEVTEGDINLDSVKVRSGNIEIEVKNESSKPSTIVLKKVTGLADRVPPEGYYALSIGGTAVVNNYHDDKPFNGFFETEFFEVPKAYNVITAAPGSANEFNTYVQMKIDDTTMIVGSDTIEMDAAPYISEGRTMLPIRYVANAFGISNDNIHFDQNSKTVTLVTQNRTVQLTVGSRTILSNGTPIEMDVAAEITDGRTFIPVMWVATALGISQPVWDEATRTVTFNGEYASNDALGSEVASNTTTADQEVSTDDADEDEE